MSRSRYGRAGAWLFIVCSLLACSLPAQTVAIRDVTVISGTGAPSLAHATVVVQGGRITAVGPTADVAIPPGANVIDGSGRYVIPGLFEMHAHVSKARASSLGMFVVNGVTTLRDMGGDHEELQRWREEVRRGGRLGPRMLLAGPYLESARNVARMRNTPVEEMAEPVERTRVPVGSPARARHVVDSLSALEVDYLKIRTVEDEATYRAIVAAAREHGLDVVGHVFGIAPETVIDAGQRGVEHVFYPPLDSLTRDQRLAIWRRLREAGIGVVPTLVASTLSVFPPDSVLRAVVDDSLGAGDPRRRYVSVFQRLDWREQVTEQDAERRALFRRLFRSSVRNLWEMREAGVPIMAGSDVAVLNVFPGSSLHDELELLVREVGMTPMEALEAATRVPATFLGLADSVGTIERGKVADLVLLEGDPLADIGNVRRIHTVVVRGRVLDPDALEAAREGVLAAPDLRENDWVREKSGDR